MVVKKRCLLWDWTNSSGPGNPGVPWAMDQCNFNGPISSVSNWNTWVPPELQGRAPYRPMVHLEAQLSGQDWDNVWNSDQPIVHFFNEPDKNNISPERAADAWYNQMVPLRQQKGKQLVSPSVSSDDNGKNWLADFMNRVSDAPPDFLGLHYYGTDGNACIQYLQDMHSRYPQSVIVSEIASTDRNVGSVYNFTVQLANFMDNADWIFEYGFFGCMRQLADGFVSPDAQLMGPDGTFTDLMKKLQWDQPIAPPS
ncbi:MAG: hypothetical protein Q9170_001148 [Blastenia crenularia]